MHTRFVVKIPSLEFEIMIKSRDFAPSGEFGIEPAALRPLVNNLHTWQRLYQALDTTVAELPIIRAAELRVRFLP